MKILYLLLEYALFTISCLALFLYGWRMVSMSPYFLVAVSMIVLGCINQYLEKHPEADRWNMVLGVAKGVEYLHSELLIFLAKIF